jgi:hypothetical protein
MFRRLSSAVLCVAASLTFLVAAVDAAPPRPLGILSLDDYCRSLGYEQSVLSEPRTGPNAAYGNWRCLGSVGTVRPISMEQACMWQYSLKAVQAHPTDPDDAYTWLCYAVGNT